MSRAKEERFDELRLMIQPTSTGRKIAPEDEQQAKSILADGQIYADGVWRVKLHYGNAFNVGRQAMMTVTYTGKNAPVSSGKRIARHSPCRRRVFHTGEISLSLVVKTSDDMAVSRIDIASTSHDVILDDKFGIRDGYVSDSPNQSWEGDNLCVVSDGTVTCEYCDRRVVNPALDELAVIRMTGNVRYTVSEATWVVVCTTADDETEEKVVLYTDSEDMEEIFAKLDGFLDELELTRFDDLLA